MNILILVYTYVAVPRFQLGFLYIGLVKTCTIHYFVILNGNMKYERQNIHIDKLLPVLYLFLIISLPTSLLDTKVLASSDSVFSKRSRARIILKIIQNSVSVGTQCI